MPLPDEYPKIPFGETKIPIKTVLKLTHEAICKAYSFRGLLQKYPAITCYDESTRFYRLHLFPVRLIPIFSLLTATEKYGDFWPMAPYL